MIALRITATTPHGVVLSRPWGVALDGLLASVLWHRRKWAARAAGEDFTYQHSQTPEILHLPLARCGDPERDADWHWMATFADLHPRPLDATEPDIRWRSSRTDRGRLQHLSPVIGSQAVSDSTGRYQRRIVPVMAHPATTLSWRAVGDPDRIRDLLTDLPSIGKHRGVGEGLVTHWEVSETPDVPEWVAGHEHEPGVLGPTAPPRCARPTCTRRAARLPTNRPADRPRLAPGPCGCATGEIHRLNTERRRGRRYLRCRRWFIRARFLVYCHCGGRHGSPSAGLMGGGSAGVSGASGSRSRWCSCSAGAGGDETGGACLPVTGGPAALSCSVDTGVAGARAGLSGGDGSTLCGA